MYSMYRIFDVKLCRLWSCTVYCLHRCINIFLAVIYTNKVPVTDIKHIITYQGYHVCIVTIVVSFSRTVLCKVFSYNWISSSAGILWPKYCPFFVAYKKNVLLIIRDHSFPRNTEFWAKPRNLPVSADFCVFLRNFLEFCTGWWKRDKCSIFWLGFGGRRK